MDNFPPPLRENLPDAPPQHPTFPPTPAPVPPTPVPPTPVPPAPDPNKLNIAAIVVGVLVDVVASQIIGVALGLVVGGVWLANIIQQVQANPTAANTMSNQAAMTRQMMALFASPAMMIAIVVSSTLGTLLGGYVAASMARHAVIKHALLMSVLGIALTLLFLMGNQMFPRNAIFLCCLLMPPAAVLGALIFQSRQKAAR